MLSNSNNNNNTTQVDPDTVPIEKFEDLNLREELSQGIYGYGWEKPTRVQKRALRALCNGRNVTCQAQAGDGKSGVFAIATLNRLQDDNPNVQVLVLSPTKELAKQTHTVFCALSRYFPRTAVLLCIGGQGTFREDQKALRDGVSANSTPIKVIIGTPGRILDYAKKKLFDPTRVRTLILDEADELLSRGFRDNIAELFQLLAPDVQVGLFSATMPEDMLSIANQFQDNCVKLLLENKEVPVERVAQYYVPFDSQEQTERQEVLLDLLKLLTIQQCIIYVNRCERAEQLFEFLTKQHGVPTAHLHSKLEKDQRSDVMEQFRAGSARILIASDLIARGIDVPQVNLVVNFDVPTQKETYIHRICRTGRNGSLGVAISFVTPQDAALLTAVEKHYEKKIEELPMDVSIIYDECRG